MLCDRACRRHVCRGDNSEPDTAAAGFVAGARDTSMRWIIGDIHGCAKPLDRLIEAVTARDPDAFFIFVGDYVNRGPDSRGVIDRLLALPNARFCRGNHDNMFDLLLHGTCYDIRNDFMHAHAVFTQFLDAGIDRTLLSYGINLADVFNLAVNWSNKRLYDLMAPVPRSHRLFFRRLEPVIEHDDIFIAHARWPVDQPDGPELMIDLLDNSRKLRHEVIWGRFKRIEIDAAKVWRRRGFFGHTPVSVYHISDNGVMPIVGQQMVLLDTAIALGMDGRLTAYCADNDRFIQVDRQLDVAEWSAVAPVNE